MNLIRKLTADFFREKFIGGLYVLNDEPHVVCEINRTLEVTAKDKVAEARYKEVEAEIRRLDRTPMPERYTEEAVEQWAEEVERDEDGDPMMSLETWADHNGFQQNREYLEARKTYAALIAERNALMKHMTGHEEIYKVRSVNLAKAEVVDVHENEFMSANMFWDFQEGFRVFPFKKDGIFGNYIWMGPSTNGARCVKIPTWEAEHNFSNRWLARYAFFLQEDRWKHLLNQEGVELPKAIAALKEEKISSRKDVGRRDIGALLNNGKALLVYRHGTSHRILFKNDAVIAEINDEGNIERYKKSMYFVAEKEGAVPCLQ